jgi:hypothetical protein
MRCLLSCPRKRYQYPIEIIASYDLNRILQSSIRQYRCDAFEEDQAVKNYMMQRIDQTLAQLMEQYPERSEQQNLRVARQNLADDMMREQDLSLMSGFLTLSVAIDATRQEQYFVDVEQIPVPFTELQDETCYRLFRQMSDMRDTFAGIDLRL